MEYRMGRFKPPQIPGSQYITAEGARRLREELDELWKVERPEGYPGGVRSCSPR